MTEELEKPAEDSQLGRMLGAYQKIRSRRSEIKREYTEADEDLKAKLSMIEVGLMKMMNETGSDSLKVAGVGLAYATLKTFTKAKDWEAVWQYIEESNNIDLLQRRLSTKAVQEYMDANDGDLPPGVDVSQERTVVVRTA